MPRCWLRWCTWTHPPLFHLNILEGLEAFTMTNIHSQIQIHSCLVVNSISFNPQMRSILEIHFSHIFCFLFKKSNPTLFLKDFDLLNRNYIMHKRMYLCMPRCILYQYSEMLITKACKHIYCTYKCKRKHKSTHSQMHTVNNTIQNMKEGLCAGIVNREERLKGKIWKECVGTCCDKQKFLFCLHLFTGTFLQYTTQQCFRDWA